MAVGVCPCFCLWTYWFSTWQKLKLKHLQHVAIIFQGALLFEPWSLLKFNLAAGFLKKNGHSLEYLSKFSICASPKVHLVCQEFLLVLQFSHWREKWRESLCKILGGNKMYYQRCADDDRYICRCMCDINELWINL